MLRDTDFDTERSCKVEEVGYLKVSHQFMYLLDFPCAADRNQYVVGLPVGLCIR